MAGLIDKFALLRQKASEVLPAHAFAYIDSGAADEISLEENRRSWQRIKLVPRCMLNLTGADTSCMLFGEKLSLPLIIAPMALHGWVHTDGECATARVAQKCGIPLGVSMFASKDVEDIVQSGAKPFFLQQFYMNSDIEFVKSFLENTYSNGCSCIVVTVDAPVAGVREGYNRTDFVFDENTFALSKYERWKRKHCDAGNLESLFEEGVEDCDWRVIQWIKSVVDVKVLIKGLLSPVDAALAVDHGADGIVVSNHGARQLDTVASPVEVLPAIARAVNKRVPILIDGGVQRGTDIIKAIAMGASAVMIGRPILFALASGGEAAAETVIEDIRTQFRKALILTGFSSVDQINSDVLYSPLSKL